MRAGTLGRTNRSLDINLIDMDSLAVEHPEFVYDLPGGEARLMQKSTGYVSTFVAVRLQLEHSRFEQPVGGQGDKRWNN